MKRKYFRNFSIIAHVDHGKSTLSDRIIEYTKSISDRQMKNQILDSMDIERERGITIKLNSVQLTYKNPKDGHEYFFNLIDTPGHVDFTYEVSRSLAACEGVILVVDATKGVQSQTVANMLMALENNLTVIPVINKIDLPSADVELTKKQLYENFEIDENEIICISAKNGINIDELISAIISRIPYPKGNESLPTKALIFDSFYDSYQGAVCYIRVVDGSLKLNDKVVMMSTSADYIISKIGVKTPLKFAEKNELLTGEVGFFSANIKNLKDIKIGDTVTLYDNPADKPLPGYQVIKPMIFASIYLARPEDFNLLKDAMEKISISDASLIYEYDNSQVLGPGIRCGFLGLLHMDIIWERLQREYNLDLVVTLPSVYYKVTLTNKTSMIINNPSKMVDRSKISSISEPYIRANIICPDEYIGNVMEICSNFRGNYIDMKIEGHNIKKLVYEMPLAETIYSFFNKLKSVSKGYAIFDYWFIGFKESSLVKVDILLNGEPVDSLSFISHKDFAYNRARIVCSKLKELIPRHLFEIPIQAAIGSKIICRETIKAFRKDVTAKLHGGDVSRKKKLLEQQKAGKKKLKTIGKVSVPQNIFVNILKEE